MSSTWGIEYPISRIQDGNVFETLKGTLHVLAHLCSGQSDVV
jgi:hypothetical protein